MTDLFERMCYAFLKCYFGCRLVFGFLVRGAHPRRHLCRVPKRVLPTTGGWSLVYGSPGTRVRVVAQTQPTYQDGTVCKARRIGPNFCPAAKSREKDRSADQDDPGGA